MRINLLATQRDINELLEGFNVMPGGSNCQRSKGHINRDTASPNQSD